MKLSRAISELLYPSDIKCVICGDDLPRKTRYNVCDRCELSFNTKFCLRCGRAMKNMADYCDRCQNEIYNFDLARAPFEYTGEVVHIVHRLKYGGAKYLAETFAQFMADTYFEQKIEADFVTYIPMHRKKQKNRGYNQAELIAKSLSEIINLPLVSTLERVKQTTNFAKMNRSQRAEAVKGVYALAAHKAELKDKRILLVDDVFTTGATANECSALLKSAKCKMVSVLTFATAKIKPELY